MSNPMDSLLKWTYLALFVSLGALAVWIAFEWAWRFSWM